MTNFSLCDNIKRPHIVGPKKIYKDLPINSETFIRGQVPEFMYAVIETGGKQYKVQQGDIIYVEKLDVEEGSNVDFKTIALFGDGKITVDGAVDSAKVVGKVMKNGKGKKITVFTYKPKKGQKRKLGHRQPYTKVQIESINV